MPRIARLLPLMMPGELTTSDVDWTQLQGAILEGGYQLETILAADEGEATFKARVLGDPAANAFAKVFVAGPSAAEEQVASWLRAKQLSSKHLAAPIGAGQTERDGATLAYIVLRRADETLDGAVAERRLSKEEASEVLLALARGLEQLHTHGLVHGCVSPEQIVAIGDSIQLSTECVRSVGAEPLAQLPRAKYVAPESKGRNGAPEADVWCVGATLVEILTQQRCGENCAEQAAKLPAPFDGIARRCLEADAGRRPRLGEVEGLLRGQAQVDAKKAPLAPRVARPAAAVPVPNGTSIKAPPTIPMRPAQEPKLRAWWIYAAAGIVVVLMLIWLFRPKHQVVAPARQIAAAPAAPARGTAWESKTITPNDSKTVSHPQPSTAAATVASTTPSGGAGVSDLVKGPVWRVVLYTYTREADADSKARWVNTKYPGLSAETFSPGGGSPYLVVAGGRMSRDEAARLRQRVRSLGLPRDSYIQNYRR